MRFILLAVLGFQLAAADRFQAIRERGAHLEAERRWADAAALYETALHQPDPEPGDTEKFWLRMSLGEMYFNRGEYRQTRRWLKEAEEAAPHGPKTGPLWGQFLNARAALRLVEGKLSAASQDLAEAAVAEADAPAFTLHNLASLETQMGRLHAAEEHQRRALALWREQYGEGHEYVMRAWISLSSILGLKGDWPGAERSLNQAMAIAETPEALSNYAVVLDRLRRGKEAKAIRKRIGAIATPNTVIDAKAMPGERNQLRVVAR